MAREPRFVFKRLPGGKIAVEVDTGDHGVIIQATADEFAAAAAALAPGRQTKKRVTDIKRLIEGE